MPVGKNSTQFNVTIPKSDQRIMDEIQKRAAALRWSKSAYALEVWRWWYSQGCPAVSAQDQAMILAEQMAKTESAKLGKRSA